MSLFHSILLGLIQGVAEFLPISSSGHLALFQTFFGMENMEEKYMFFTVLLHFGTLISVCMVYWRDIVDMILEFFRGIGDLIHGTTPTPVPPARRMILLVIVGTLPLFVILPFKDWIEGLSSNLYVVGYACIRLLKMIADKGKFGAFAYYCWAAGLLTVILKFVKG